MLLLAFALQLQDPDFARAESLFAAHDLRAARTVAERLVGNHPADATAHLLLGRIWFAWPTVGRYQALSEFKTAERLAPNDLQPLYWQTQVGDFLGGAEGERLIRESLIRTLALDPECRGCWEQFAGLYHDRGIWEQADRALARHATDPVAMERRAEIALALDQPRRTDSLAAILLAQPEPGFAAYLFRAQAAFLERSDAVGEAWYDSALAHVDRDSGELLWDQIKTIASPAEVARHDSTPPEELGRFYRWFWAKRDPNLVTPSNERLAEHFRRLAEVRHMFGLLHPVTLYHRSRRYRALVSTYVDDVYGTLDSLRPGSFLLRNRSDEGPGDRQLTLYALAGLNAEGLIWLRHGRPNHWDRDIDAPFPVDQWTYYTADGPLSITFGGIPSAFGGHGDPIVAPPRTRREDRQARELLSTDGTSLPATLTARGWSAFFKSPELGNTDLYLRALPETAAAVLWSEADEEIGRVHGPGLLVLTAPPGRYRLGLDVDSGGHVGRVRESLRLPAFSRTALGLSSLALATADSLTDREATLAAMPGDLTYPAGRPLVAYAEIYGLASDRRGLARYTVTYTFAPVRSLAGRLFGGGGPLVFEFAREAPGRAMIPEQLAIDPGRVPPGRYRVTLAVTDRATDVRSETVAIEITIR